MRRRDEHRALAIIALATWGFARQFDEARSTELFAKGLTCGDA
jgi:hypothetical protein